jgi:cubilin
MIGRFCGTSITFDRNAYLVSSHNQLYFWFRSDHSAAGQGFQFTWNTVDPGDDPSFCRVCGANDLTNAE